MLLTSTNQNTSILQNIVATLEQCKVTGTPNKPMVIDTVNPSSTQKGFDTLSDAQFEALDSMDFLGLSTEPANVYSVSFYVDEQRTNLLFTDTSTASPSKFSIVSGRAFYTPSDTGLNDNTTVSTTLSQWVYFVTVTSTAGLNKNMAYNNSNNLLFQKVSVTSTPNPKFLTNGTQGVLHPLNERQINKSVSGLYGHVIASFDLYLQQPVFDWSNLSEQNRIQAQQQMANLVRNALYADRFRGGTCTLLDAQINGTMVKDFRPIPSDALLKGVMRIDCVSWTQGDSNF